MRTSTIKALSAIALTGAGSALIVGFQAPETALVASTTTVDATSTTTTTTTTTSQAASSPDTQVAVAAGASYADGTWTGAAVDEPWGTFQVQAVVSGGVITDVVVVSAPTDGHSSRINNQAIPTLTQAAIASQSAELDLVSGATWTSQSYTTSLQAALDAAQAAADTAA